MVIFCHFNFCHIRKKSFQLKLRKLREVTVSTIQNYNGVHSLFVWLPSSREKKKIFPWCITTFMYNHIISSILIYFSSNLIYLLLILLYHAINKKRRFLQPFSLFFSCHRNLLLLFPSCNLYFWFLQNNNFMVWMRLMKFEVKNLTACLLLITYVFSQKCYHICCSLSLI